MLEQQQRIVNDVLSYIKIFDEKVEWYIDQVEKQQVKPAEFKEYLRKTSVPKINLTLLLLTNLEKKLSELALHDETRSRLLEHVRKLNTYWKSTAQIIDGISKANDESILKAHKKFENILKKNKQVIFSEGDILYKKMMMFS
jgi:hypothetical protein